MFSATPFIKFRQFDLNGLPLAGGKLYSYVAGSLDPQDTYTDATGSTVNENPVILDSSGYADVFLDDTQSYYIELYDANDVLQWSEDNISTGVDGGEGDAVLTTTDQEINGVKVFHETVGFGQGDIDEYSTSALPIVVGSQADTDTGIQVVGNGVLSLNFGINEQGSDSTLGGVAYDNDTSTLLFRSDGATSLTVNNDTIVATAQSMTLNGVPVLTEIGVLEIDQGGTGETTAADAINALLPDQTGNTGKVLATDGSTAAWVDSGNISSSLYASSGYVVFGDGLVMQWGYQPYGAGAQSVSFATEFPNACFSVTTGISRSGSNSGQAPTITGISTSGFTLRHADASTGTLWQAVGW